MKAVIQRVKKASVTINEKQEANIQNGLLILLGIESADSKTDADWIANKILQMRIFEDDTQKMNLSIQDIKGEILVVSQFTLYASTKKGNRPSFIQAAKPEIAIPLYTYFLEYCNISIPTKAGVFGANMQVELINDGPVTIILTSKNKV